ncbi:LCI fold-containing protein [Bacillus sp. SL00103]
MSVLQVILKLNFNMGYYQPTGIFANSFEQDGIK